MGNGTKRCWDMDDQPKKKFKASKLEQKQGTKSYGYCNINELETSTVEIGVDGTPFDHVNQGELQTLNQRKELKEFIFQPLSTDSCNL